MGHLTTKDAYKNLGDRINWFTQGAPPSESLYKILQVLYTEKEAKWVALLPVRPFTLKKAAKIWGTSEAKAEKLLDHLCEKALLVDSEYHGQRQFVMPPPMKQALASKQFKSIYLTKRRSASLTSTAFKTSAGAASWIKVARVNSLASTLEDLKKRNIWIYGAEADGTPFYQAKLEGGCCLVIGSEGYGLSRLVREKCDQVLSIDMYGHVNSLNASVSAGILIYEAVRYRRGK